MSRFRSPEYQSHGSLHGAVAVAVSGALGRLASGEHPQLAFLSFFPIAGRPTTVGYRKDIEHIVDDSVNN